MFILIPDGFQKSKTSFERGFWSNISWFLPILHPIHICRNIDFDAKNTFLLRFSTKVINQNQKFSLNAPYNDAFCTLRWTTERDLASNMMYQNDVPPLNRDSKGSQKKRHYDKYAISLTRSNRGECDNPVCSQHIQEPFMYR